jgi:hypothetical protein
MRASGSVDAVGIIKRADAAQHSSTVAGVEQAHKIPRIVNAALRAFHSNGSPFKTPNMEWLAPNNNFKVFIFQILVREFH